MSEIFDDIAHIEELSKAQVLCVGDLMLDRFIEGEVTRISPEAPIPVFRVIHETVMLGGAGNVVRNLSALGAVTHFIAAVGDDPSAKEIMRLLSQEPAVTPSLLEIKGRQTSIKTRFVASHQQIMRSDRECTDVLADGVQKDILRRTKASLKSCGVMILSDYGKGVLPPKVAQDVIALAREAGKPVIVDPKGEDFSHYKGASLLTPNVMELSAATRKSVGTQAEVIDAAKALINQCGVDAVLVTRGADGMTLVHGDKNKEPQHFATEAIDVFDVSGAGDTVVAMLGAGLAAGIDLSTCVRLANTAAGIVVSKSGTAVVHPSDLLASMRHQGMVAGEAKIVSLDEGMDRINQWRRRGRKVGFTNGCFDLLHPGHISLLEQAKGACDYLVVGLNSDSSVARLGKGEDRPIQGEAARATVLSSLEMVDMVIVFSEDTPLRLIEAMRPDVLVKGADYKIDQVVGADVVHEYGGHVVLVDILSGFSTTSTLEKMSK